MLSMGAIQVVTYVSLLVFAVAVIARALRYGRTPIHMRWELYPVAHERGRAHYGGSVFEEPDWWKQPRQPDRLGEVKEMAREIFLLKGVWHHNRQLWYSSFPFHFGLYLLIGWMLLLALGAVLVLAGATGGLVSLVQAAAVVCGWSGLLLTGVGACGLLIRRAGNVQMRRYNSPAEYFNLVFFIIAIGIAILAHAMHDPGFVALRSYYASLIGFAAPPALPSLLAFAILLGAVLVAYIPLTRMVHFVAKYFLYHDVRWSDEPNPRGSKIEARLKQAFNYGVGWSAPHIQSGKSWLEVTMEDDS
jgi:nitrate reductase gamma subunit